MLQHTEDDDGLEPGGRVRRKEAHLRTAAPVFSRSHCSDIVAAQSTIYFSRPPRPLLSSPLLLQPSFHLSKKRREITTSVKRGVFLGFMRPPNLNYFAAVVANFVLSSFPPFTTIIDDSLNFFLPMWVKKFHNCGYKSTITKAFLPLPHSESYG